MNILSVKWPPFTKVQWMGRNGCFDSSGLQIDNMIDRIVLRPVTSREKIGNGFIEIPRAAIPDLLKAICMAVAPPTISPEKEIASPSKADGDTSTPALVATGQGERLPRLEDIKLPSELPNGILRMDADFMADVQRR